jgi:hypothetical protein
MKLYLHESRADKNLVIHGVEFVNGVAEVLDHEVTLIDYLERYYGVQRTAPAKAQKAEKPAPKADEK